MTHPHPSASDADLFNIDYDSKINDIMIFLFEYQCSKIKSQKYPCVLQKFNQLDIAATYFLFDLIEERLPHRAKLLFAGENYQGKRDSVLEVMAHNAKI